MLGYLFWTFFQIGLFSIGGGYAVIPLIQEQVVGKNGWVSRQIFTDIITISQMTPGPLAVNTSTFVGLQIAGIPGAIVATLGCVLAGIVLAVILYAFVRRYQKSVYVLEVLNGLKAASLGLIISAAATILKLAFTRTSIEGSEVLGIEWIAVFLFSAAFICLRRFKMNPILLMLVTGMLGCILYL